MGIKFTGGDAEHAATREFGDDKARIIIGRDPAQCDLVVGDDAATSDIVFEGDVRIVGREHLALERVLGRYRLVLNTDNLVKVDGVEAFDGQELPESCEIELGLDGPKLRVERLDAGGLEKTLDVDGKQTQTGEIVRRNRKRMRVLIAAVVVVVAALSWVGFEISQQKREIVRLADRETIGIPQDIIDRTRESVYLVLQREPGGGEFAFGTAWVVDEGTLATNAHVAEEIQIALAEYEEFDVPEAERNRFFVRSTADPYPSFEVTATRLHPGYERFFELLREYRPVVEFGDVDFQSLDPVQAADVALMFVDGGAALGRPLEIASDAELAELRAGQPVVYLGFPMEELVAGGLNMRKPTPTVQTGIITAVTNFLMMDTPSGDGRLVQHSMGATGGASGSPIINAEGKVVAVLSAGNIVWIPVIDGWGDIVGEMRAPSAVDINFGQRADFVIDLVEGREARRLAEYESYWRDSLALLESENEAMERLLIASWQDYYGVEAMPELVDERTGEVGAPTGPYEVPVDFYFQDLEPGVYVLIVVPDGEWDLDLYVYQGDFNVSFDEDYSLQATVDIRVEQPGTYEIAVVSGQGAPYFLKMFKWPLPGS